MWEENQKDQKTLWVIYLPTSKEKRTLILSQRERVTTEALDVIDWSHFSKIFGENIVIYMEVKEMGMPFISNLWNREVICVHCGLTRDQILRLSEKE